MTTPTHNQDELIELIAAGIAKVRAEFAVHPEDFGGALSDDDLAAFIYMEIANHRPRPPADSEVVEGCEHEFIGHSEGVPYCGKCGAVKLQRLQAALSNGSAPEREAVELAPVYLPLDNTDDAAFKGALETWLQCRDKARFDRDISLKAAIRTYLSYAQPQPNGSATGEGVEAVRGAAEGIGMGKTSYAPAKPLSAHYAEVLRECITKDGKCSKCGKWCNGCIDCFCEGKPWYEPLTLDDIRAKLDTLLPKGEGE